MEVSSLNPTASTPAVVEQNQRVQQSMIVVSDEQVWANLHSIVHWHQHQGGLKEVFIYHTGDEVRSKLPAFRLQTLLHECFPEIQVVLPSTAQGCLPQEVRQQIQGWRSENPDRHWVLNTTGGLPLMALGMIPFAGQPGLRIVQRESTGEWFEWQVTPGNELQAVAITDLAAPETDLLPVLALVRSQFASPDKTIEITSEPVVALPIKWLTTMAISLDWNWTAAFKACSLDANPPVSELFEQYLGAALLEMGLPNIARHVNVGCAQDKNLKCAIDLVANHGGQVVLVDLELQNEADERQRQLESLIPQIRQAAEVRNSLRGLGARAVLVRPCRLLSESERELAKAYNLEVIDQSEGSRLFSRLAKVFGVSVLPPVLQETEDLLVEQVATRGRRRVFGPEIRSLRDQERDSGAPEYVDLDGYLDRVRAERGQNWLLWTTRSKIFLLLEKPANPPAQMARLIENGLKAFGKPLVQEMPNGYEVAFFRNDTTLKALRTALGGFVNRQFNPMVFVQAADPSLLQPIAGPPPPIPGSKPGVTAPGLPRRTMVPPHKVPQFKPPTKDGLSDLESAFDLGDKD